MRPTLSIKPVRTQGDTHLYSVFFDAQHLTETDAPTADALVADALSVLDESDSWDTKLVKDGATIRRRKVVDGLPWFCRVSQHAQGDLPFDLLWDKLGVQRFPSQKQYLTDVTRVNLLEAGSKNRTVWSAYHAPSSLMSPRIFTVLLETRLREYPPQARAGIAIEIPVDVSAQASFAEMEERGVRAYAVTIEYIKEIEDGSKVEWRVITCRDYDGRLPPSVWLRQMPDRLVEVCANSLWVLATHNSRCPPAIRTTMMR
ncbi:hypothetical protein BD626DRAFT_396948 [Schizophyllum amplum]|uniref:DUF3074 domain-containing protein n=1 Tax=Schizophyllum amplum TaxID=97359 RepID=A0A550CPJ4_9AGAR|nr:hypothetical protein BD626DRAFT_396948 [Auriculariopsis ampla]